MPSLMPFSIVPSQSPAPADRRRADRVHDAYCALSDDFLRWKPSEPFRAVFESSVLMEIRRRTTAADVRILEIGCGHGTWAEEVFTRINDSDERVRYQGVDFAEPRVQAARRRMADHPGAKFVVADADEFEPAARYDLILAVEVISHLSRRHYRAWIRRWRDWLNPGGSIVILDKEKYTRHSVRLQWDALKRRLLPSRLRGKPYYFAEDFGDLLRTLHYPSFAHVTRTTRRFGYRPRPIVSHGPFRALIADRPEAC